jgi:hypothetical protein
MRGFKMSETTVARYPVTIGHFLVLQMTEDTYKGFTQALEEGDVLDFSEIEEDDLKVVADFEGVGLGEVV